jgi:hypothetical protein
MANLIAAAGNHGRGGTGVMWTADLRAYALNTGFTERDIRARIIEAGLAGAAIINLSVERDTTTDSPRQVVLKSGARP